MEFYFNKQVAVIYGVEAATMVHNLIHWIEKNRANGRHFYKSNYWTYNSLKAYSELFPFWTKRQIERILNGLIEKGAIISDEFNEKGYDRTKWYAINDKKIFEFYGLKSESFCISPNGEMHFTKRGNGVHQTVTPIPDNKPYSKHNLNINVVSKEPTLHQRLCAVWLNEIHIGWTFGAIQGKCITSIGEKIKKIQKAAGLSTDDPDVERIFRIMCQKLPEWYKDKDLQVINAKFNEIITEIKNQKNGNKQQFDKDNGQIFRKSI